MPLLTGFVLSCTFCSSAFIANIMGVHVGQKSGVSALCDNQSLSYCGSENELAVFMTWFRNSCQQQHLGARSRKWRSTPVLRLCSRLWKWQVGPSQEKPCLSCSDLEDFVQFSFPHWPHLSTVCISLLFLSLHRFVPQGSKHKKYLCGNTDKQNTSAKSSYFWSTAFGRKVTFALK